MIWTEVIRDVLADTALLVLAFLLGCGWYRSWIWQGCARAHKPEHSNQEHGE